VNKTRVFYGWKFALTIALPLLLASLGVALLTFNLLARVSTGANVEDRERTRQIVTSALGAVQQQLANTATDNSYWDDAVRWLYGTPNAEWVAETYSVSTESGVNYDVMLVVDRDLPEAAAGNRKGQVFLPTMQTYFSGKLDPLLDLLPKDIKTHDSKAAILNTGDGLAVVAVAPILPTSEDVVVPAKKPRYMVFLKFLTPEYLAAIGSQYVIQDLVMVTTGGGDSGGEIIKDFTGMPVASIQWTDRRPGDIARAAVWWKAIIVLNFLALAIIGITILCWRLIRSVDKAVKAEAEARRDTGMFKDLNHQVTLLNMELETKIRELREAQEEIVRKGKMAQLGQLTATVAHELRNPLSVVRTGAFMVRRKISAEGLNLDQNLARIESGITRCDNIISQLLDFARVDKPDFAMTDLDNWLAAAIEEEATKLPSAIKINCALGLGALRVAFDADRMRRVMSNILSNASEALVGKGSMRSATQTHSPTIQVSTRLGPLGVEIIITDNGPGMSDEVLGKIREPLFTTKHFGTGLGIPAVEQILDLHGGGLDIWSKPGQGARFTAWFPVLHQESQAA
jgi:signal transduction histidine kinase